MLLVCVKKTNLMPDDDNFFMIFIIEICRKSSPLSVTQTKNSGSPMGVLSQGRAYYEELATNYHNVLN